MKRSIFALLGATALVGGAAFYGRTQAESVVAADVNVGSLVCTPAGGSTAPDAARHFDCLFARTDGVAEPYRADLKESASGAQATMVWLVFSSGTVEPGALAGAFGRAGQDLQNPALPPGAFLIGGDKESIVLAPVRVPGRKGLNVAEGVAQVRLRQGG